MCVCVCVCIVCVYVRKREKQILSERKGSEFIEGNRRNKKRFTNFNKKRQKNKYIPVVRRLLVKNNLADRHLTDKMMGQHNIFTTKMLLSPFHRRAFFFSTSRSNVSRPNGFRAKDVSFIRFRCKRKSQRESQLITHGLSRKVFKINLGRIGLVSLG